MVAVIAFSLYKFKSMATWKPPLSVFVIGTFIQLIPTILLFANGYHIGMINNGWYIYMKTWSQSCHSFHAVKALASPKLSKRATPKAPRLCTYIESTLDNERQNHSKPMKTVYNTPHEAFPLLCS